MGVWCWEFHYKFDFFKHLTHEKKKKQWYKNLRYLELHQISKFSSDESLFFLICDIKNCINYPSFPVMEVCFFLFLYFPNRSPIKVPFLGTSQIFHLALHFIAGEGMKCFPCLVDGVLICLGALAFPTSCTICGTLEPNGPGATHYTANIPDPLRQ